MCSFVRARMARWASRSLARLRASCDGVKVDTLLVPDVECQHTDSFDTGVPTQATGGRLTFPLLGLGRLLLLCW